MRHSGVSPPLQSCNVSSLTTTSLRFLAVRLLDDKNLYFLVEPKSKIKELYNQACAHLASQGMLDTDLFGLAVQLDSEYMFVDADCKISKYAQKNWKSSSSHGLDNAGMPLLTFHFQVQFYVDSPLLLRDDVSRHYYYLQLRQNVVYQELVYNCVAEEVLYLLVGLALQADYGNFNDSCHYEENYFSLHDYFPKQMVVSVNESQLYQNASIIHRVNHSFTKAQAETQFIREASSCDTFPVAYNSHIYRLKQKKQEPNPGSLWLAICTRGVKLYEEKSNKPTSGTLYWNNIGKLCFDRKKFEIRTLNCPEERMTYYTSSDEKSKHLLTLCRLTHQFCMSIQSKLTDLARKEEEEKNHFRDWGTELNLKLNNICYTHRTDQRISVISDTSSNTTSGIVSDRVQSLDESEDDLEMEIMINSPPAASVESLALAHLRDSFNNPCRISSKFTPIVQNDDKQENRENTTPINMSKISLPVTPAPTDGSQCSSSCSTVVVNGISAESAIQTRISVGTSNISTHRRHSTNSSLELGYSHTAQNSAVSDSVSCLEMDFSVQSAHTSSGIYTLQSSCETNTVATTTAACSSETSGICHSILEDSEGHRSRSGSIVSTSGSFHGDGSDPSDTGHGTPLTAEELSDLIVGRSPKPCRGKYPSIATVSESLDSIADYVTLPPPPIPPHCHSQIEKISNSNMFSTSHSTLDFVSPKSSGEFSYKATQGSVSNVSLSSTHNRFINEEAMLQRQIQFQHLAGGYSPQLLMDTLPGQSLLTKPYIGSIIPQKNLFTGGYESVYPNRRSCINDNMVHPLRLQCHKSCTSLPQMEEANARLVNANPHISILKPHTGYASPKNIGTNYIKPCSSEYLLPHNKISSYDVSLKSKVTKYPQQCNIIPIVGNNNYLDVRKSGAAFLKQIHEKFPPPPPLLHRQPPPPPPSIAPPPPPPRNISLSQHNNQLSLQLERYKQQLYSDVDYVMYPMKDPALSKQEYLDSKTALQHCSQVLPPPPPYPVHTRKSQMIYRSTPNVAASCVPVVRHNCMGIKYASNQNLSSANTSHLSSKCSSSTSPLYLGIASSLYSGTASSYSSSMQSLHFDSITNSVPTFSIPNSSFVRTQSDDNILKNNHENFNFIANVPSTVNARRPPPPPPLDTKISVSDNMSQCKKRCDKFNQNSLPKSSMYSSESKDLDANVSLDICSLREKSRNLDLPLISALCNDRSLLKQTNTIDLCNVSFRKKNSRPLSWHTGSTIYTCLDINDETDSTNNSSNKI